MTPYSSYDFTTKDEDNDVHDTINCAVSYPGDEHEHFWNEIGLHNNKYLHMPRITTEALKSIGKSCRI